MMKNVHVTSLVKSECSRRNISVFWYCRTDSARTCFFRVPFVCFLPATTASAQTRLQSLPVVWTKHSWEALAKACHPREKRQQGLFRDVCFGNGTRRRRMEKQIRCSCDACLLVFDLSPRGRESDDEYLSAVSFP